MDPIFALLVGLLLGVAVGVLIGVLIGRARATAARERLALRFTSGRIPKR